MEKELLFFRNEIRKNANLEQKNIDYVYSVYFIIIIIIRMFEFSETKQKKHAYDTEKQITNTI
jgi:hypothetical protein